MVFSENSSTTHLRLNHPCLLRQELGTKGSGDGDILHYQSNNSNYDAWMNDGDCWVYKYMYRVRAVFEVDIRQKDEHVFILDLHVPIHKIVTQ